MAALLCVLGTGGILCTQVLSPQESRAQADPSAPDSVKERGSRLRAARTERAEHLRAPRKTTLEEFFLWIEENQLLRRITGVAGRKIRLLPGGLGRGSGIALRLAYVPFPQRDNLDVRLSAGGSIEGYWQFVGSVGYRQEAWFTYAYSKVQERPETTYLSFPALSDAPTPLTVDITSWASGGVLGLRPLPGLSLAATAGYLENAAGGVGAGSGRSGVLDPAASTRYATVGGHITLDFRDVRYGRDFGARYIPLGDDDLTDRPLNPGTGTLVSADYTRYRELSDRSASFSQLELEAQQYVSFLNGYHTFALRHRTTFTDPDAGAAVPFYRLPYVGGNFTLRGYDEFRFQGGSHALLYNLEYRYKVWHHADMVLFGDAGKVFDRVEEWGFTDLRYSYGAEVRFTTPRNTLFRFGVALNEDRDPRLIFEFSNVF